MLTVKSPFYQCAALTPAALADFEAQIAQVACNLKSRDFVNSMLAETRKALHKAPPVAFATMATQMDEASAIRADASLERNKAERCQADHLARALRFENHRAWGYAL